MGAIHARPGSCSSCLWSFEKDELPLHIKHFHAAPAEEPSRSGSGPTYRNLPPAIKEHQGGPRKSRYILPNTSPHPHGEHLSCANMHPSHPQSPAIFTDFSPIHTLQTYISTARRQWGTHIPSFRPSVSVLPSFHPCPLTHHIAL
jgi:hypothetical protein